MTLRCLPDGRGGPRAEDGDLGWGRNRRSHHVEVVLTPRAGARLPRARAEEGDTEDEPGPPRAPQRGRGRGPGGSVSPARPDEARALPPGRPSGLRPGGCDGQRSGETALRSGGCAGPGGSYLPRAWSAQDARPSPGGSAWSSPSLTRTPAPVSGPAGWGSRH